METSVDIIEQSNDELETKTQSESEDEFNKSVAVKKIKRRSQCVRPEVNDLEDDQDFCVLDKSATFYSDDSENEQSEVSKTSDPVIHQKNNRIRRIIDSDDEDESRPIENSESSSDETPAFDSDLMSESE